ncbi:MAG: hypothetical protein AAFX87_31695 [Bacteroidota bacterium]
MTTLHLKTPVMSKRQVNYNKVNYLQFNYDLIFNKNKKVITSVMDYYDGHIQSFPYTAREVEGAKKWYFKRHKDEDSLLTERIAMLQQMLNR